MNLKSLTLVAFACFTFVIAHGQAPETPPSAPTPPIDRVAGMAIEDMRSAVQMRFERMDTNGDGFLSKDEFPEGRGLGGSRRASGEAVGRGGERPRAGDRTQQRQARMPMRLRSFDEYDSNKDGQVSKDELSAPIDELASLDTNGDGRLDRREMRSARQPRDVAKKAPKSAQ